MDRHAETFVRLRDTLVKLGVAEDKAIYVARRQTESLAPLLASDTVPAIPSKSLAWEVSRRAEQCLRPLIQRGQAELPVKLFESWRDFADSWHGEPSLYGDIEAGMWGLFTKVWEGGDIHPGLARQGVIALLGAMEATLEPPVLLQERPKAPVRLVFWGTAQAVCAWATLVVPTWVAVAEGLTDVPNGPHPPTDFVELWRTLQELLDCASLLAHLQWDAAGIVGSLCGRDNIGLAWYPFAVRYGGDSQKRFETFMAEGERPSLAQKVETTPTLELVGSVTRHILYGKPLDVPVLSRVELYLGEKPVSSRVIINHPLVSAKEIAHMTQEARKALGRRFHPLSGGDEAFLDLVRELGGVPGRRLPKGFWERFQTEWARRYPDNPLSVNHLRVKYHRLARRIQSANKTVP